jgi:hypothetical protein
MSDTTIISQHDSPRNNFTLTSDAYSVNGAPFAITFITERCVVVESAWLTTSQACRSRASAEKFCELAAPYITRKIANWVTVTLARMIAALDLTPPTDDTPAAMPLVRQQVSVAACGRGATSPEDSATIRHQILMCAETGESNPLKAHDKLMAQYLASKAQPTEKEHIINMAAPESAPAILRRFAEKIAAETAGVTD